jgi:hypothetical protein
MSSVGSADRPQLPVAEPTSDDEFQLINEVESLQRQLKRAGDPVDEKFAQMFFNSVTPKPLTERIRKWKARRDYLQKLVDRPHATLPPDHLQTMPVVRNRDDSETTVKAAMDVEYRDPPQRAGAGENKRRRDNAQPEPRPGKRKYTKPRFHYSDREDGTAPQMSLLHVNFATLCVNLLRKEPDLTMADLIKQFNASEYSTL